MTRNNKECHYNFDSPKAIEKVDKSIARHFTLEQIRIASEIKKSQYYKIKKICIVGWGRRDYEIYTNACPGIENELEPNQKIEIAKDLGKKAYDHFVKVTNKENIFLDRHRDIIQLIENNLLNHEPISIYRLQHESKEKGFYTIKNIIDYVENKLGIKDNDEKIDLNVSNESKDFIFHKKYKCKYDDIIAMKKYGIAEYKIQNYLHLDKVTLKKIKNNPYFILYVENPNPQPLSEPKPKIEEPIIEEPKTSLKDPTLTDLENKFDNIIQMLINGKSNRYIQDKIHLTHDTLENDYYKNETFKQKIDEYSGNNDIDLNKIVLKHLRYETREKILRDYLQKLYDENPIQKIILHKLAQDFCVDIYRVVKITKEYKFVKPAKKIREPKPKIEKPKKEKKIKETIEPEIKPEQVPLRVSLDKFIAKANKNYNPLDDKKILEANQRALFAEIEARRQK